MIYWDKETIELAQKLKYYKSNMREEVLEKDKKLNS